MKSGTVPNEWKHARVIPSYKDGKCDEASNYRPISVLPIISKIMERIVHDQLYTFGYSTEILSKLRNYGIRGDELSWFTSYLTDRSQSVSLENVTSDSMDISYGVPQGLILGPLLFTLYINDLTSVTKTCKVFFTLMTQLLFIVTNKKGKLKNT